MSSLNDILDSKTKEFKRMSSEELLLKTKNGHYFEEEIQGKKYYFEINTKKIENDDVMVNLECSVKRFLFFFSGRQKCFKVSRAGVVQDIDCSKFY